MAFSDDQIRAIVKTGQLSDPAAEGLPGGLPIERRDKIGKAFFAKVLPLDLFTVRNGELAFEDLAQKHGLRTTGLLKVSWSRFDDETEQKTPLAQQTGSRSRWTGRPVGTRLTMRPRSRAKGTGGGP
jgi:hypothetical protein